MSDLAVECDAVYAGISIHGSTNLYLIQNGALTGRRYRNEILTLTVAPFTVTIGDNFMLLDVKCGPHSTDRVDDNLFEEHVLPMEWSAYSPDRNPIEHL